MVRHALSLVSQLVPPFVSQLVSLLVSQLSAAAATTAAATATATATATTATTATTTANSSNNNDNDHDIYNTVDELTPPPRSLFPRVASPTPPIPGAWLQYGQPLGQPSALRKVLGEATVIAGLAMKNDQNS